jgi:methionyl-tRNA formyltransferase
VLERCRDVNADTFVHRIRAIEADLIIVAGCPHILRQPIREAARWGVLNFHPSLLPDYRGRQPLFWAILNDERRVGVTLYWMTDEVDAGPILLQHEVCVPADATSASLARAVDRVACTVVPRVVEWLREGALPSGRVPLEHGSRYPPLRELDGHIHWARPAAEINRRVRACSGEIEAYSHHRSARIIIRETTLVPTPYSTRGCPGEILSIEGDGFVVATADGALRVTGWHLSNGVHAAEELAAWLPLKVGAQLGVSVRT